MSETSEGLGGRPGAPKRTEVGVIRDSRGRFIEGTRPGPGMTARGRLEAIRTLDAMLAESGNVEKLRDALQRSFDRNPMRFFKSIIMPLLPKTAVLGIESEGGHAAVKIIAGVAEDRL